MYSAASHNFFKPNCASLACQIWRVVGEAPKRKGSVNQGSEMNLLCCCLFFALLSFFHPKSVVFAKGVFLLVPENVAVPWQHKQVLVVVTRRFLQSPFRYLHSTCLVASLPPP